MCAQTLPAVYMFRVRYIRALALSAVCPVENYCCCSESLGVALGGSGSVAQHVGNQGSMGAGTKPMGRAGRYAAVCVTAACPVLCMAYHAPR